MPSCRAVAALGAPAALTKLGQCCSSRLRLCQEIGFLGTCSESNLKIFRPHNPRPALAPENRHLTTYHRVLKEMGLASVMPCLITSHLPKQRDLIIMREKCRRNPSVAGPALQTSTPRSLFTVQHCLNVGAAPASSRPAPAMPKVSPARSGRAEGAEGSPSPSLPPSSCWQTPHLPSWLGSLQEERETRLARRWPQ